MIPPVFRKPFFISFFLFLIMLFSVSAYKIVHYDSFDYVSNATNLINHGFIAGANQGYNGCVASGSFLECCGSAASSQFWIKLNQVAPSYCVMGNETYNGGAKNFSFRYRISNVPGVGYAAGDLTRAFVSQANLTNYNGFLLFLANQTNQIQYQRLWQAIVNNTYIPFDTSYHNIQFDYSTNPSAAPASRQYAVNITIDGDAIYNTLGTPVNLNCINTTFFDYRTGCVYIDDVVVIAYDSGETFIAPDAVIANPTLANNSMPLFNAVVQNKNGVLTTRTDATTDCTPIPIPFTNTTKENPKCNPLYFSAPGAFDAEGDIMSIGVSCNNAQEYLFFDGMSADLSILNPRYLTKCNYTKILYNSPDGNQYYGLELANTMNCTAPILTSSFSNSTAEPNLLSNLASDIIEFDFYPDNENLTHFEFTNYNLLRVIQLGIRYNATRGGFVIYENGIEKYLAGGFDTSSATTLKIVLDKATYTYTYSLLQGTVTKKRFYSTPVSFDWTFPLSIFEFYVTDSSGNFAKDGTAFGRLSGHYITLPSLETWNVNKVFNCTSANYGYYRAYMFMSDSTHGLNYGNYEAVDWTVETIPLNTDIINAVQPDSFENGWTSIFMGSQTLKYIFALMVFLGITFAAFMGGAMLGNAMAGGIIAMFAGVAVIFFFILMGVLPTWFGIVIFMVMALITAFILRKVFVPTAN